MATFLCRLASTYRWTSLAMLAATFVSSAAIGADPTAFETVKPIFERHCLSCHNSIDRKGDFALQTSQELTDSGMIEPGDSEASYLLDVLLPEGDEPPQMPKDADPLTEAEVDAIRKWIQAGADWPEGRSLAEPKVDNFDWWSLRPISRPDIPSPSIDDASSANWSRTTIDHFILAMLRKQHLTPSPEADRRTLIRRLTYDLTGLPPTPEELTTFINNDDPLAYERLVDRLLASPHYGERWGRHWLDVAKYADTCGYDKDKLRSNAWPYRDYVIRSFNDDKPYARFVREQIAGDVLYPGEPDGILGLGFVAAGPWDFIGHVEVSESKIDGKVARNLDRDEMVGNTLNTFCSVTIQCARCHNHKFDPITQKHYYSLQSVFAAVDRAERPYDLDPQIEMRRRQLAATRDDAKNELAILEKAIRNDGGEALTAVERKLAELKPKTVPQEQRPEYGYHSAIAASPNVEKWVQIDLGREVELSKIVLRPCHDDFAGIGAGFGFPIRFRVEAARDEVAFDRDDSSQSLRNVSDVTDGLKTHPTGGPGLAAVEIDAAGITARYVRVTATQLAERKDDYLFAMAELTIFDKSGNDLSGGVRVTALDSIEAPVRWSIDNLTDGIWPQPGDKEAASQFADLQRQRDVILSRINTPERQQTQATLEQTIAKTQKSLSELPAGHMVYAAATHFKPQGQFQPTDGTPRPVTVLHRGNVTQPGETVQPGVFPLSDEATTTLPLPDDATEADGRAALADWLTDPDHPLVWRSIVNRLWQYHFGRGLVNTPNDFGRMGQPPTHPALLNWLATEFHDSGGSMKHLHRLIVTSAVYRQVSTNRDEFSTIDAGNRYLWRMNRRRLSAEEIRDAILAVSGRLNTQMGGPGYYLFELEKPEHSPHYQYHKHDPSDPDSHRRAVYRFVVRSQPDPWMTTLDCADSSQSTPKREETLTSLQALSLLNSRFNLAMAESFATRLKTESDAPSQQIEAAMQLITGRPPTPDETQQLKTYAATHGLPSLCRLLFNLSEFVFVD